MTNIAATAVAKTKQHYFTMHGLARRAQTTTIALAGYYLGLGILDTNTSMEQFLDVAQRPYAILGVALVVLGGSATTGVKKQ